jgi:glutamine synthetase
MTRQSLHQHLLQRSDPQVTYAVVDLDGLLRGKRIHRDKLLKDQPLGFCDVIFGWDAVDALYANGQVTGWHTGYPDAMARIDWDSYREIPWQGGQPLFMADFMADTGPVGQVCPRSLLRRVAAEAEAMGLLPHFGAELEWVHFAETPHDLAQRKYHDPQPLSPGMFGYSLMRLGEHHALSDALFQQMEALGVSLECLHTETGPGVYEAALQHTPVLAAADGAALFKWGAKVIARQQGLMASFMAKWHDQLPGCGGHLHQSLWSLDGQQNLFFDPNDPQRMSALMRHYLAGQLACLPYLMPLLAPTVNSYKRLLGGDWAPATVSWGRENRTTSLRIIGQDADTIRIENRLPGADLNPYLAMAASLAAGLYGIREQLPLEVPAVIGNGYQADGQVPLPRSLDEAVKQMRASALPATLLGEAFIDHFGRSRDHEWRQYLRHVGDWERQRYFEGI